MGCACGPLGGTLLPSLRPEPAALSSVTNFSQAQKKGPEPVRSAPRTYG